MKVVIEKLVKNGLVIDKNNYRVVATDDGIHTKVRHTIEGVDGVALEFDEVKELYMLREELADAQRAVERETHYILKDTAKEWEEAAFDAINSFINGKTIEELYNYEDCPTLVIT